MNKDGITPEDLQAAYHNMQAYMASKNNLMANILSMLLQNMSDLQQMRVTELQGRTAIIKLIKDSPEDAARVLQDTMSITELYNECFDHLFEMLIPIKDAAVQGHYFIIDDTDAAAALNMTLDEYLANFPLEDPNQDMSFIDEAEEIANQQYKQGKHTAPGQTPDPDDDRLTPV